MVTAAAELKTNVMENRRRYLVLPVWRSRRGYQKPLRGDSL